MDELDYKRKLAYDSKILLEEVIKEVRLFGEDLIQNIIVNENGDTIILETKSQQSIEYNLSEVSYILSDKVNGLWKNGKSVFDIIETKKLMSYEKYLKLYRDDFIEYMGRIEYLSYRFEEIHCELEKIEKIA
ncbi:MAG: hypothetical protein PUE01_10840 [Clostridiaceae bacterium]|nr:hypothetical protein [Clostridiaceae bacterium]